MIYLVNQINKQKVLETEVNTAKFIKDNGITNDSIIHTLSFDKSVFIEEKEVREYMKEVMYMYSEEINIRETDDSFTVEPINADLIDIETQVSVELRRGVTAHAAEIRILAPSNSFEFNAKGEMNLSSKIKSVDFSNGMPAIIEIARVATGVHPKYGPISVTEEDLESMVKNFDAKVTRIDLAVNEDHEKKEAFGWYKDVWLSFDGKTLYGQIDWNTKGTQALADKEYRYFSPEFRFNYIQPMTGEEHGATLLGGALTNYPFLEMDAIVELSNKQIKEPIMETIELSVHNKAVIDLNGKVNTVQVELNAKTVENGVLTSKVKELEDTISLNAKKASHQKLFDNGVVNAAQLTALNEGKGTLEVLALNAKTTNAPAGKTTTTDDDVVIELNATEKKAASDLGLTEEEFAATNL